MKRPGKHIRFVRTKKGKKKVLVNPNIRKKKKFSIKLPQEVRDDLASHLKKGHNVSIPQIGTFRFRKTKAKPRRKGINPFTREPTMFKAKPASKEVKFRLAKRLKEML